MSTITDKAKNKISKIAKSDTTKKAIETTGKIVANPLFLKLALGSILLYGGYRVVKSLADKVSNVIDTDISDLGDANIDNQVEGTGGSTTGATITNTQANNYAQQLLDACNAMYPMYGTDTDTISAVFKKFITPTDFIKVYNAFGLKDYNGYNSPPTGIWSYLDSYDKHNLVYWLKSELSESDEPYSLVKSVIESAGFVF